MPRRGGPIEKRHVPNVQKVVVVASGKGGVGKSTIATNLAFALSVRQNRTTNARLRVGILDLDIFGPSIPTLMGLQNAGEPELTEKGALRPLRNGLPCMSMGFLMPSTTPADGTEGDNIDTPVVWRGLMVQKAVQQLLFDVDWRENGQPLDVLVVDMPPGTGDVPLTLGQLVKVDASVIVSTPQDVALSDVRKGIAMLKKVDVPITGLVLNHAYYLSPDDLSLTKRYLFGKPDNFHTVAGKLQVPILGELPLAEGVNASGDGGCPYYLSTVEADMQGGIVWKEELKKIAKAVDESLYGPCT
ncbi:P-loop containing nucleoside triphosphate hydrolase protein [Crepidotus variabilis]|uniref:P-loop containing nucleoside triphosphate hydrolase protein n=1 Tax=Crepidotus variabilis TaxID=179855 RepID=A0A9P6JNX1_9AGAR|nr:P-loop containing nucleoside triphosphate hydrolase protein [Crepidotus variabilis]